MIGTADQLADIPRLIHQHQAAVTTDVVKHSDTTCLAQHHQQGMSGDRDRHGITNVPEVMRKADADPVPLKHAIPFSAPEVVLRIGF